MHVTKNTSGEQILLINEFICKKIIDTLLPILLEA